MIGKAESAGPLYDDEKMILSRVAKGDESAFRVLFDRHRQKIYNLAMYLTRSEVHSEEILQDVFMKVWKNRAQLNEIIYFNAWLRTIARNTTTNYLKSLAREKLALGKLQRNQSTDKNATEYEMLEKQYKQLLEEAIAQLPPQQKRVYLLSRTGGLRYELIAAEMGITVNTTKEHLKKALGSIRGYLDKRIELIVAAAILLYLP